VSFGSIDIAAVMAVFSGDAPTRIARIKEALAALQHAENHKETRDALEALTREAHNLRGAAAMLELRRIENLAGLIELEAEPDDVRPGRVEAIARAADRIVSELNELATTAPAAPATAPVDAEREPGAGPIVLHVEDNLSNLKLVERILARRPGVQLVEAQTGERGLELAQTLTPALVLLDLRLPDLAGDEVLRRLRADPATRVLRVVVVSAEARPAEAKRLIAQGAYDYLVKPIEVDALLDVVDDALRVLEK
jgi:CheY-like chemotaxis protein